MNARVAASMRTERESTVLFGFFALAALVLATVGVYGTAAYMTARRTKEIGIRVALGAHRRHVWQLVAVQTLWPTLIGIAVGAACGTLLTRLIGSLLFGVKPLDPLTFVGSALVLLGAAMAATWIPARRATRIDPIVALRHE